jgi:hypothetical protein
MKYGCAAADPEFGKLIVPSTAFCADADEPTSPHTRVSSNVGLTRAIRTSAVKTRP